MIYYCLSWLGRGGWLGITLVVWVLLSRQVQAHGDTVIASGTSTSGNYGWMLSVSPYPVTTGPVNLSLLVFDSKTSAIVNTVAGELYLAAPGSPQPCCQSGVHLGPLPLLLEPFQFGDYIAYAPIDQLGIWEVQLNLTVASDSFTLVAPFEVVADGGLDKAAIQAAVDELTQAALQQMSATAQPASPLPAPTATRPEVAQAPSPLFTLRPTQQPGPAANPAITRLDPRWLISGGAIAIVAGLWLGWQIRKKS